MNLTACCQCRNIAVVEGRCVSHAMAYQIALGNKDGAFAIAKRFDRPKSAVLALIRDQLDRDLDAEIKAMNLSGQVHATTPVQRARRKALRHATEDMLAAVGRITRAA